MYIQRDNKCLKSLLVRSDALSAGVRKWNQKFDDLNWKNIYRKCFETTIDTQLRWFQVRLKHRILPTGEFLFLRKIKNFTTVYLLQSLLCWRWWSLNLCLSLRWFMMVRGANLPPIIAWKVSNTLRAFSFSRSNLSLVCFGLLIFFRRRRKVSKSWLLPMSDSWKTSCSGNAHFWSEARPH